MEIVFPKVNKLKNSDLLLPILNDKRSGSQDLLIKINKILLKNIKQHDSLHRIISIFKNSFSEFQIINSNLVKYEKLLQKNQMQQLENYLKESFHHYEDTYRIIFKKLYSHYSQSDLIFTLSNSRTIIEVLKIWRQYNKNIKVTICESRPKYEGRIAAIKLATHGVETSLITDAAIANFIQQADLVLIGADKILKDGSVINKIGSLSAAIAAKYYEKPFIAAASKEKISQRANSLVKSENPKEILTKQVKNLNPINIYFEVVPKSLITKIITD